MTFQDKVIWITGASSGIGEALALALAKQQARLVLSARRADELHRVATATGLPDSHLLLLPLDISAVGTLAEAVDQVLDRFGAIDYVFQNAGISQRSRVADTDFAVYRRLMDVNFFGVVALTQAILPGMLAKKNGHFVVTSSVSGKIGVKQRAGYCASKHALHGFFDSLRAEVANDGLRVTMVCPGYIRTPISRSALNAQGGSYDRSDQHQAAGMPADGCAQRILKAVANQREEVYIGGSEIIGIYLKRFWPGLLSRILRNRQEEK